MKNRNAAGVLGLCAILSAGRVCAQKNPPRPNQPPALQAPGQQNVPTLQPLVPPTLGLAPLNLNPGTLATPTTLSGAAVAPNTKGGANAANPNNIVPLAPVIGLATVAPAPITTPLNAPITGGFLATQPLAVQGSPYIVTPDAHGGLPLLTLGMNSLTPLTLTPLTTATLGLARLSPFNGFPPNAPDYMGSAARLQIVYIASPVIALGGSAQPGYTPPGNGGYDPNAGLNLPAGVNVPNAGTNSAAGNLGNITNSLGALNGLLVGGLIR